MSKKKAAASNNSNKKKSQQEQDEDWDAILAAVPVPVQVAPAPAAPAAEDDEDDSEEEDEGGTASKKDKDKRKKKKKTKKEKEESSSKKPAPKLSAAAQAALAHQQRVAEEEARLKKLREEEEQRIREEEERIAAEERRIEEEKERKRKIKQDKKDAQKLAGTYMTKAEKERARKVAAKLESLVAAGFVQVPAAAGEDVPKVDATNASSLYKNNKKKNANNNKVDVPSVKASDLSPAVKDDVPDDWDAESESDEDDEEPAEEAVADDWEAADEWDADDADDRVQKLLQSRIQAASEEVEDELDLEKRRNDERLLFLGRERQRREEEARQRKEEEDRLREEMERKEAEALMRKELSRKNRLERDERAKAARSPDLLRSPISCIMGHVDTGKTKLLDKIRHTNVQEGEAGGITQQIGATQFSKETLSVQTQSMQASDPFDIRIPGLLVIDTPGHESFSNLRSRGSSLCDIAILVIDLMHGLEPQTIESINLLKRRRCPFVVALNKVDRCYGWKTMKDSPIRLALAAQDENVHFEFKDRSERIIVQLMELGLNAKLYWQNDDLAHTVSLVPTSAISGEGVPDLLKMVITLTQNRLTEQLMYSEALQCTVLEVKVIEGLGHTVDCVLVNGRLRQGDTIVVSTMDGPVVTTIRALLTPPPNREMRIKSEYIHHQELQGAIGIKIVAPDIGRVVAGTPLLVIEAGDDVEDVKEDVQSDLTKVLKSLHTDPRGVMVHASTLGALEALLQFLRDETSDSKPPIPVAHINIGPIHKKDVMIASIMHDKGLPEFATILAFDVAIDSDARDMAEESNVRIFSADIIYHLFDQFTAFMNGLREARKKEAAEVVVFPVVLKILQQHVFNKKDPIVIGVEVSEGTLHINTPLSIPQLGVDVGRVTRIEINHKEVTTAKKGTQVAIRIVNETNPTITYGRQFDHTNALYSKISRQSINACKEFFKDELTKDDWALTVKLKKLFDIM